MRWNKTKKILLRKSIIYDGVVTKLMLINCFTIQRFTFPYFFVSFINKV